jgi:predicted nucleotidyltransferase
MRISKGVLGGRARILTKFKDIPKIAKEICKIKNVEAVYLFGSYARGKQGPLSDIDLCVIGNLNKKSKRKILKFGASNMNILIFNELPVYRKMEILRFGKEIIINDINELSKIRILTLHEYEDFRYSFSKYLIDKCRQGLTNMPFIEK